MIIMEKELNKGVVRFELQDWTSKVLGSYTTLEEAEEHQWNIVVNDEEVQNAKTEEEREEIENGIMEDLYIIGFDDDGKQVIVEFG